MLFAVTLFQHYEVVAGCSRSEATRPTLASQVNPKAEYSGKFSWLSSKPQFLSGEDGELRCPIKSN